GLVSDTVASIKGLALQIDVDDRASGRCVIEFGRSAAPLSEIAKPLLLEVVGKAGVAIDGVQTWTAKTNGNTIAYAGSLPVDGLQRLRSIVDPPSPRMADGRPAGGGAGPEGGGGGDTQQSTMIAASKAYYKAVCGILDNVSTLLRRAPSMQQSGTYISRD